ncbi:Uncharacterised protein [uncultured Leptotrichia sp.]|uniref:hypothetical protein n=1 Tax=uncultured Leptotrichia sp. TaxID=159271 RepID=UPI001A54CA5B|nr:hypothetical protein [uncultured Leptotrichia sp.]VTX79229.1 Uncharacterised protein [uncultured Leptotrichia sp.]
MENLKLEMIDFIMKNKEIEETDMIFSFNSGEIKVYLDYQTGELKDTVYCDNQEEIKNKIKLSIPLKLIGSATFSYEYGLYEYVQIDMEDKLEKYLYNDKKIYILNEKEIFLELQISEKESLFFNEEYFLIGFGIEKETSSLIDNKIENETEKNKNKKPIEQTYDSIRNWLLPLLRKDDKIIFPKEEFLERVKLFDEAEKLRTFNVIKLAIEHDNYCVKFEEGKIIEGYEVIKAFGEMLGIAVEEETGEKVEEKEEEKKLTPQQLRKKYFLKRMKNSE